MKKYRVSMQQIAWAILQTLVFSKFTNIMAFVKANLVRVSAAIFLLPVVLFLPDRCVAESTRDLGLPLSAAQLSLGFIVPLHQPDPLSFAANPLSLNAIQKWALASSYSSLHGLKALGLFAVAGGARAGTWVFAAGLSQFGNELYKEQGLFFGFSGLGPRQFSYGATARLHNVVVKNYGEVRAFTLDAAWRYTLTRKARLYGSIKNINRGSLGRTQEPLPQAYVMGVQLREQFVVLLWEFYKEVRFAPEMRIGLEVASLSILKLRLGMTHRPARLGGGFSIKWDALALEYGFSHHNSLGYTHVVTAVLSR